MAAAHSIRLAIIAQVCFVIDGQPICDQQSKVFSTQLPVGAVQSMELITGNPGAEFGDKTSLIAEVTTRSGLGAGRFFGNIDASFGGFGTAGGTVGLGWGTAKFGDFIAIDGVRSGRFLDTPEFTAFHDKGNNQTIFDRLDLQPNGTDAFHLNLFAARNWIQIPNDYDQLTQDQRQRVLTWSIAPAYQHTISAHTLLTINPYLRKDQFNSIRVGVCSPTVRQHRARIASYSIGAYAPTYPEQLESTPSSTASI